jgi:hypothetical protein
MPIYVLVLAPSLIPRLLLRPHHVVPYVASGELRALAFDAAASAITYNLSAVLRFDSASSLTRAGTRGSGPHRSTPGRS